MEPRGLVFIFNKKVGDLEFVTKEIMPYIPNMVDNLVKEGYVSYKEQFDTITDNNGVCWARIEDSKFKNITENEQTHLAEIAIKTFYSNNPEVKISDEIKAIHYDGTKAPWKFDLILTVIYSS